MNTSFKLVRFRTSRLIHLLCSLEFWGVACSSSSSKATLLKFESLSATGVVVSKGFAGSNPASATREVDIVRG